MSQLSLHHFPSVGDVHALVIRRDTNPTTLQVVGFTIYGLTIHDFRHDGILDDIIVELRRTAHHLMPEELLKNGLVSALRDFAISLPDAHFQTVGDIRLTKDKEVVLYRCAYELVNNALKHAQAQHITIQLMQTPNEVTLTVSDDVVWCDGGMLLMVCV